MTPLRRAAAALATIALIAGASVVAAPAAHAAAGVTVANSSGSATADPEFATEVTVRGNGFQSIAKGFGGVYVLFGWVDDASGGSWRPSQGGVVGSDFRYVPDSETQDNQGFQRFVAFPGSDTESSAHGVISADGSWSVSMVIPGAVFQSHDRSGAVSSIDCRTVTCGIITIGAHGVKNANNETFTPIAFAAVTGSSASETDEPEQPQAAAPGDVRVGLATASVAAGASIVFTGQGFTPGEQVVAALDDGLTAIGPLTAGSRGEVAGALPVPRDARGGTHLVSLTGAASGAVAQTEVMVNADAAASASAAVDERQVPQWTVIVLIVSIVIAAILVIASALTSISRARARRKRAQAGAHTAETAPALAAVPAEVPASVYRDPHVGPPTDGDADVRDGGPQTAPTEILHVPERTP